MGDLLTHALSYAGLGLEIFPVGRDKRPLQSQHEATTDLDQIEAWWERFPDALIGHRPAPGVVLLDIDPRHNGKATWAAIRAELNGGVPVTRTHYSGRGDGGGHVWFQRPEGELGIVRLDAWARAKGLGALIEGSQRWTGGIDILRHEHRYTILPPSPHPDTHKPYHWARGKGLAIEPAAMPAWLAGMLRRPEAATPRDTTQWRDPDSIADWYSANHSLTEVLTEAGWVLRSGGGDDDGSEWQHPEATTAVSATVRHGCLFVYSTSTPFEPTEPGDPRGYTPFAAYTTLVHAGDASKAARAARELKGPTHGSGVSSELTLNPRKGGPESNGTGQQDLSQEEAPQRRLILTPLSAIGAKRVRWCWEGRLALGTLGLLAGPEGLGKSTLASTIGAQITRGTLPGEYEGQPRAVLVAATEDSFEHTIRPRWEAAGADLDRVYRIEVRVDDTLTMPISLPDDLVRLGEAATEMGAALLILDPLISRLNQHLDSHKDGEVRSALEPLVSVADDTGMSIVGLIHHNKSGKADPLDLVMASKAFTAVARSVHTVIKDPDDESGGRRYFGTPKNNLGRLDLPSLGFTIMGHTYETDDGPSTTGKIVWLEESQESISSIIGRTTSEPGKGTKLQDAMEWLAEYMAEHGPRVATNTVKAAGKSAGHSARTLDRAREKLKIEATKGDFTGGWFWVVNEPDSIQGDDL